MHCTLCLDIVSSVIELHCLLLLLRVVDMPLVILGCCVVVNASLMKTLAA